MTRVFCGSFRCQSVLTAKKFKIDDPESVCVYVCFCVSVPLKRFLENYLSPLHQIWHRDCLRHENASHVNYIDLDLHSRSHLNHENNKCLIVSSNAHEVCCEDSPTKGLYDYCQSDDLDLHSIHKCVSNLTTF